MQRIFLTLAIASNLLLAVAIWLGLNIGDATLLDPGVQGNVNLHFLTGLGALVFGTMVHALVLTYFMGTGRWMEDTSNAYRLGETWFLRNKALKYRTLPVMVFCVLMLILTGAAGGASDPASPTSAKTLLGMGMGTLHLWLASITMIVNLLGTALEYRSLRANGLVVNEVLTEVARIREEHGLPT